RHVVEWARGHKKKNLHFIKCQIDFLSSLEQREALRGKVDARLKLGAASSRELMNLTGYSPGALSSWMRGMGYRVLTAREGGLKVTYYDRQVEPVPRSSPAYHCPSCGVVTAVRRD